MTVRSRFVRFAVVGAAGFAVDATLMSLLVYGSRIDPFIARTFSVYAAMTATYLLNRMVTFPDRTGNPASQYGAFLAANSAGALVNYATYAAILLLAGTGGALPLLATALGSVAGLAINFTASDRWVFRTR